MEAEDDEHENIGIHFDDVCESLDNALSVKQEQSESVSSVKPAVFVHCAQGRSRSPSIILAFLMKKRGFDLKKAYEHVLSVNPSLNLNEGFKKQLMAYEKKLTEKSTLDFFQLSTRKCRKVPSSRASVLL